MIQEIPENCDSLKDILDFFIQNNPEKDIFDEFLYNYYQPKPYKFKDFKIDMWVYDKNPEIEEFTFFKIKKILSKNDCEYLYHDEKKKIFFDNMTCHAREFEENRFFPVIVAMLEVKNENRRTL